MTEAPTDFDVAVDTCARLAAQTRRLVDALSHNLHGQVIGRQYMGGDGGLVTTPTLIELDKTRALLEELGA